MYASVELIVCMEIPFSIDALNIRGIWKLFCSFSYLIPEMNIILDVFFEEFFKNNIDTTLRYAVIRQFEALSDKEEGLSSPGGGGLHTSTRNDRSHSFAQIFLRQFQSILHPVKTMPSISREMKNI